MNIFINITDNKLINYCTNKHTNKGIGELIQIKYMLKFVNDITFSNLFKITGRYIINEKFDFKKYDNDKNIFKHNNSIEISKYYYTSFYKISNANYSKYFNIIEKLFNCNIKNYIYEPLEVILSRAMNYDFELFDTLGITERIAVINYSTEI